VATTVADADVLIHADVSKFAAELLKKIKPILKAINATLTVDVDGDTDKLLDSVKEAKKRIERDKAKLDIDGDTEKFEKAVEQAKRGATRGISAKVPLELDINVDKERSRIVSKIGEIGRQAGTFFTDQLGKGISKLGEVAEFVGSTALRTLVSSGTLLSVVLPVAAGGAFLLGKAFLALLPLAGAIPGALLAGGAAAGIATLAFHNFGEALSGDREAMKKLSPSARELVGVLRSFLPELRSIQQLVQQNIFRGLAGPVKELLSDLLPNLRSALDRVSNSINGSLLKSLEVLNSEAGKSKISEIFSNTADSVGTISKALPSVTDALLSVSAAGSRIVKSIAPDIEKKIEDISDKIKKFADSGEMERSFKKAKDTAEDIKNALVTTFQIGKSIGGAVSEGFTALFPKDKGNLELLNKSLRELKKQLDDPTIQEGLKVIGFSLFALAAAAGIAAFSILFILGALARVGQGLDDAWRKIQQFRDNIRSVAPDIGLSLTAPFTTAFAAISTGFDFSTAGIITKLKGVPSAINTALSLVPDSIGNPFSQGFGLAGTNTDLGVSNIVGIVGTIAGRVSTVIAPVVGAITNRITAGFNSATTEAQNGVNRIVSVAASIPTRIRSAVGDLSGLLEGAGRAAIDSLIRGLNSRLAALRNVAASIAGVIKNNLPNSPAKEGPLSGRGAPELSGRHITESIGEGLLEKERQLRAAVVKLITGSNLTFQPQVLATSSFTSGGPPPSAPAGTNNTKTISPTVNVYASSADPEIVASKVVRRIATAGAF
jgi:phage-related protein